MNPSAEHSPWKVDSRGFGYLPGLDGIRALAVLGVLLYHADYDWIPGGFLGVDVFFVLSGFLITSLIFEELQRKGRVDFKRFYLGRARRLLPALLLMLFVVGIAVAFWYRDAAYQFGRDALASAFYLNNWWYIHANLSYFEATGRPPLLTHLWSLAVEEQFYLVWPVVVVVLSMRLRRRAVGLVALLLALVSTGWMISLAVRTGMPEYADPSRAYFGTDSHAMGLLIGAALASIWRPGRMTGTLTAGASRILTGIGLAALAGVLWFFLTVDEYTPWLYRGGFLALALIVALLIAMASHPGLALGRAMGTQPLRYLGQRSYGLYLWHWPIFMVTRPELDIPLDGIALFGLRMGLTLGIAELSFRYVEMPIRHGVIGRWWTSVRTGTGRTRIRARSVGAAVMAVVLLGTCFMGATFATASPTLPAADVIAAIGLENGGPTVIDAASPDPSSTSKAHHLPAVTAIGDSVMLGARGALQRAVDGLRVDAAVARYPGAFIGRVNRLDRAGVLGPVVILHPGTNGVIPEDMMRTLMDRLSSHQVIVVNDAVRRSWSRLNNSVMASVVKDYPNATLVDWHGAADGHPEYFVSDGVHLTGPGAAAYSQLIADAVTRAKASAGPTPSPSPTN